MICAKEVVADEGEIVNSVFFLPVDSSFFSDTPMRVALTTRRQTTATTTLLMDNSLRKPMMARARGLYVTVGAAGGNERTRRQKRRTDDDVEQSDIVRDIVNSGVTSA